MWHAKGYSKAVAQNLSPKEAKLALGALTERGCARTLSNTAVVCVSFGLTRLDRCLALLGKLAKHFDACVKITHYIVRH